MRVLKRLVPVVLVTAVTLVVSAVLYNEMADHEISRGKKELQTTAQNVSKQIRGKFEDEITKLHMIEEVMIENELFDAVAVDMLNLNSFQPTTMFSRIDILYPDGTMVRNGEEYTLDREVDFEEVLRRGEYMTQRLTDPSTGTECVYYVVPIVTDGELRAVLIATVDAAQLVDIFQPEIYGGMANICLIDAKDGNYIMDSWHDELMNAFDTTPRKMLKGYEGINAAEELKTLKTGLAGFESKTTGKPMYLYYTPLGLFDWQLSIFAEGDVLFYELAHLQKVSIYAGAIEALILLFYFLWNMGMVRRLESTLKEVEEKQKELHFISYRDMLTGLYNRNRYIEVIDTERNIPDFGVVYVDLNNLKVLNDSQSHEAGDRYIRNAADAMAAVFPDKCYRIGGDEFVVLQGGISQEALAAKVRELREALEQREVSVSMGSAWMAQCPEPEELLKEAEAEMYEEKKEYHRVHDRRAKV